MNHWLLTSAPDLLRIVLSCGVFYFLTIAVTRLAGLRSFTTFSSFDFLITLAMGALLATTVVSREVSVAEGLAAVGSLFALQLLVAVLRARWPRVTKWLDNPPMLLMENGQVLHANLRAVRLTEGELRAKLRAHNVFSYAQVRAVVLETSGDVSVLRDGNQDVPFQPTLLEGVVREV